MYRINKKMIIIKNIKQFCFKIDDKQSSVLKQQY